MCLKLQALLKLQACVDFAKRADPYNMYTEGRGLDVGAFVYGCVRGGRVSTECVLLHKYNN